MKQSSRNLYNTTKAIVNRLVPHRQSNVALGYNNDDVEIVKLIDPSYNYGQLSLTDFDWRKPMPKPDVTHTLGLSRTFTENEKEDIWCKLQLLESHNKYTKHTQLQIYKQKAIDLGIYRFAFEYTKGSVRAKWRKR